MIILHVSDFHFNRRWFHWLTDSAPVHDLLTISGDFIDPGSSTPRRQQIEWVSQWLREYTGPLVVCSGNSDLEWHSGSGRWTPAYWLRSLERPGLWTDGSVADLDGVAVASIGWTTRPKGASADVWVAHAAPLGASVACRRGGCDAGDPDLNAPVAHHAPRIVLTGHVHDPLVWCEQRNSTLFVNPGRNADAAAPNHVVVDTDDLSCRIVRCSGEPNEEMEQFWPRLETRMTLSHATQS